VNWDVRALGSVYLGIIRAFLFHAFAMIPTAFGPNTVTDIVQYSRYISCIT